MLIQAIIFTVVLAAACVWIFGWWYVLYRLLKGSSSNLKKLRGFVRFFGVLAVIFVFVCLLLRQIIVRESWAQPFVAPVLVAGIFVVHDIALGWVIKKAEARAKGCGVSAEDAPGDRD